jgi:hypothetical protein
MKPDVNRMMWYLHPSQCRSQNATHAPMQYPDPGTPCFLPKQNPKWYKIKGKKKGECGDHPTLKNSSSPLLVGVNLGTHPGVAGISPPPAPGVTSNLTLLPLPRPPIPASEGPAPPPVSPPPGPTLEGLTYAPPLPKFPRPSRSAADRTCWRSCGRHPGSLAASFSSFPRTRHPFPLESPFGPVLSCSCAALSFPKRFARREELEDAWEFWDIWDGERRIVRRFWLLICTGGGF